MYFFTTYKQAMDYCDMRSYVVMRGKDYEN